MPTFDIQLQERVTVGDRFRIYSNYFQKMTDDIVVIVAVNEHDSTVTAQFLRDGQELDTVAGVQVRPNWIPAL
jgi:hypothetical protein